MFIGMNIHPNLTGKSIGNWLVLERVFFTEKGKPVKDTTYKCRCGCGVVRLKSVTLLLKPGKKDRLLGCKKCGVKPKGRYSDVEPQRGIWKDMQSRCYDPKCKEYKWYGQRGIDVSLEWRESFEAFLRDMSGYIKGLSIDRIDNNKGYSKENCRWSTMKQQNRNRRSNVLITHKGRTEVLADWLTELGMLSPTYYHRVKKMGMSPTEALFSPRHIRRKTILLA